MFSTVLILSALMNTVNAQPVASPSETFTINGTVNGINNGTMMLAYPDHSGQTIILDSAQIKKGIFKFKGNVGYPVPANLYIKGFNHRYAEQNINFYLENSPIKVLVHKDSMNTSKISGSSSNDDADSIKVLIAPYYEVLGSLRKVRDFASRLNLSSVPKNIEYIYDELPGAQRTLLVGYALEHPGSYSITSMLNMNFTNNQTDLILLKKVYDHFSDAVKQSVGGQEIASLITKIERVQPGNPAPGFSLPDENGKTVDIASFKGKYVLLDFWASWCVPCRAESPYLVKAFEKYKDKNFTIVSVSMDVEKDKQKWIDAFKKDGMSWTQLCSLKGYENYGDNDVRQLYSVQGIPDNFLISPEGKIIARGLRGEGLEQKLSEIL